MTTSGTPQYTPADVAKWMYEQLTQQGELYQADVAYDIQSMFGNSFTYDNENGNLAIGKNVLAEFCKLTSKDVVWDRTERKWRFREAGDDPNKRQVAD